MSIRVDLPNDYSFTDLILYLDLVANFAEFDFVTNTKITSSGSFDGFDFSITIDGFGFNGALTQGFIGDITIRFGGETIKINGIDLANDVLSQITRSEERGDFAAFERWLLAQDWNVQMGSGDDFGTIVNVINNVVFNPRGDDVFRLGRGDDNFFLGNGKDVGFGAGGNDSIFGGAGNDTIFGGKGRDELVGGGGRDELHGGGSRDVIYGGAKADTIYGGARSDELYGNGAGDTFVFATGDGKDVIMDFDDGNNREKLDLAAVRSIKSMADLKKNHMEQVGDHVVIDDLNGLEITLINADIEAMNKAHFIF